MYKIIISDGNAIMFNERAENKEEYREKIRLGEKKKI